MFPHNPIRIDGRTLLKPSIIECTKSTKPIYCQNIREVVPSPEPQLHPLHRGQAKFMIQNIYGPQIFVSLLNLERPEDFQLF